MQRALDYLTGAVGQRAAAGGARRAGPRPMRQNRPGTEDPRSVRLGPLADLSRAERRDVTRHYAHRNLRVRVAP
jgi:hypothetical protein